MSHWKSEKTENNHMKTKKSPKSKFTRQRIGQGTLRQKQFVSSTGRSSSSLTSRSFRNDSRPLKSKSPSRKTLSTFKKPSFRVRKSGAASKPRRENQHRSRHTLSTKNILGFDVSIVLLPLSTENSLLNIKCQKNTSSRVHFQDSQIWTSASVEKNLRQETTFTSSGTSSFET